MTVLPKEKVNFCTYIMITNLKKRIKHQKLKSKYHCGKYFVGLVFQKSQRNSHKPHKLHVKCGWVTPS